VLVALGAWPGADLELSCTDARWQGLGTGAGRLGERQVRVRLRGRGVATGGRSARLLLPAPGGAVAAAPMAGAERIRGSRDVERVAG
jgi:hypothetical protein